MQWSGFDAMISGMPNRDEGFFGGASADAAVAASSPDSSELMDDPDQLPRRCAHNAVRERRNFIDFAVVPHYRSFYPEAAAAELRRNA